MGDAPASDIPSSANLSARTEAVLTASPPSLRRPRCTITSVTYRIPGSNESLRFSPRYGSWRRTQTRQPTIITRLGEIGRGTSRHENVNEGLEIDATENQLVAVAHKPPRLKFGKYSYQPIATFQNAPKAYPAKPHVEGFSASTEKAVAAAEVVRNVRRNAFALSDATYGRDIFTNFWAETSVVDSDPLGMGSSRRRSPMEELIYFDNSALDSQRSRGGFLSSRTNEESDFGYGLESSRTGITGVDSGPETGREFSDNELPDPESFEDFSSLLRNSVSRVSSDLAMPERRPRITHVETQTQAQQAQFEAEFAQWDRETSGRSGRGFIDLFSEFWGNESAAVDSGRPEGMTHSIGTDTANLGDDEESDGQRSSGRVLFARNSPWSNARNRSVGTGNNPRVSRGSSQDLSSAASSHARTRAEIVDRLLERQLEISRLFADIVDTNASIPPEFTNYPRRGGEPRSFLDQMSSQELQQPPNVEETNEETDDEESPSVFSQRSPTPDLTPNSLFETFSEGLKSIAEDIAAATARGESIPDEYFFQDENYSDFCRGRISSPKNERD